jgi:hypothetical protein
MNLVDKLKIFYKTHEQLINSFAYGFFIILITVVIFNHRQNTAQKLINQYNQFKIDIAKLGYKISEKRVIHSILTPQNIYLDVEDITIKTKANKINFEKVRIYAPKFNRKSIEIKTIGKVIINDTLTKLYDITTNIWFTKNQKFKTITSSIKSLNNSELNFIVNKTNQYTANPEAKFMDFNIFVKNSKISDININTLKISGYIKGKFIDSFNNPSLDLWLKNSGFVKIENLFIENDKFSSVAKGNLFLNNHKKLSFKFDTASYGLIKLIKKLENKNLIKREKSTVAKIILSNKKSGDKNFITTPISLSKNKLYIDRIELINFNH